MPSVPESHDLLTLDLDPDVLSEPRLRTCRPNPGHFKPGYDPRRHIFTFEERSRGGVTSFAYLLEYKPWVLLGLRKKLRLQWRERQARSRPMIPAKGEGGSYGPQQSV
jgi:hypothetical protein